MTIRILDRTAESNQLRSAKQAAEATLRHLQREGEATVVLTSDEEIRRLSREHLGLDEVTDVLAFPHGESEPGSEKVYLGDVVISLPQAVRQAEAAGHSPEAEVTLLTVHGMLHLLGFDHDQAAAKQAMWRVQEEILEALECEISQPTEA